MEIIPTIKFDADESDEITRALAGIVGHEESKQSRDKTEEPNILRRFLNSAIQGETFGYRRLIEVQSALLELGQTLLPQTEVSWWREAGAPGADEAVEGLARERQYQIARLNGVVRLVNDAVNAAQ